MTSPEPLPARPVQEPDDELVIERLDPREHPEFARPAARSTHPDDDDPDSFDGDQQDLADRLPLRRVAGMSTELADVGEVEYRQLRLERVVLVSVWTTGSQVDADNALAEL